MTDASLNAGSYDIPNQTEFDDYFALLKPRVMSLVVFTASVGMLAAPVGVHPIIAFASILFIAIGAGASGALNMWWDADIDAVMKRTAGRPIPSGKISPHEARNLGLWLSAFSVGMLAITANFLSAGLLAFTIFFLCSNLYNVAKKMDTSEYCYRWSCGSISPDDRLGCSDWWYFGRGSADVFPNIYVDAASLLGISIVYERRLFKSGCPDVDCNEWKEIDETSYFSIHSFISARRNQSIFHPIGWPSLFLCFPSPKSLVFIWCL